MDRVARQMQRAVNSEVFPGAVLLVSYMDEVIFHEPFGLADIGSGQLMKTDSLFDLASLTKPLATALCVMKLVERRVLSVDQRLGLILNESRGTDKADITVDQLLRHTSGLPAHRPFYERVVGTPEPLRRGFMRQLVLQEPLVAKPGEKQVYSDLGYILLAWVVEIVSGYQLDQFACKQIYEPAGIRDLFFMRIDKRSQVDCEKNKSRSCLKNLRRFVSTERCPWRKKIVRGEVHDDNAWAVGGVDGHAGLFGTASAVWRLLIELMHLLHGRESGLIDRELLKEFLTKKGSGEMVAGFDTPSLSGSSAGRYFSSESVGHLGFTGTSFWMDPLKSLIVVLLSNRVHPSRENQKIKAFRPEIHDMIVEVLLE